MSSGCACRRALAEESKEGDGEHELMSTDEQCERIPTML